MARNHPMKVFLIYELQISMILKM